MNDKQGEPKGFLESRLAHLFATVHPEDRGPYTPAEVAATINAQADGDKVISEVYVWQLKTGRRDNPTYRHLIALARFFGVSPAYFFPESETSRGEVPAEVAAAVRDDQIRDIALSATGLSSRSLKTIRDMVDNARALEQPAPPRRAQRARPQE
jgi:transcriptional regulator with XRE-family HTH domain